MPWVDKEPEKIWFTTRQVADSLNVSISCVRYWCDYFGVKPLKRSTGKRAISKDDFNKLAHIAILIQKEMYTLPGAREKLKSDYNKNTNYLSRL